MLRLRDDKSGTRADDALRLAEDRLDVLRVDVLRGELARAFGGLELVEADDASFCLGHDLLRDHDDVAFLELAGGGDERAEVVPCADLRQPRKRQDPQLTPHLILIRARSSSTSSRTMQS
jgi:hypothetical protein